EVNRRSDYVEPGDAKLIDMRAGQIPADQRPTRRAVATHEPQEATATTAHVEDRRTIIRPSADRVHLSPLDEGVRTVHCAWQFGHMVWLVLGRVQRSDRVVSGAGVKKQDAATGTAHHRELIGYGAVLEVPTPAHGSGRGARGTQRAQARSE